MTTNADFHIQSSISLPKENVSSSSNLKNQEQIDQTADTFLNLNYDPPISRRFMEGICGVSKNTLINYMKDGLVNPKKVKYGGIEVLTFSSKDIQAIFKKQGKSFKKKSEAEVISIFSQKGGVGKSFFSQNLAAVLALTHKVLVIDGDAQSDASSLLGVRDKNVIVDGDTELDPNILNCLDWSVKDDDEPIYPKLPLKNVIKKITNNLHIIPADIDIGEANYSISFNRDRFTPSNEPGKIKILSMVKDFIEEIKYDYDFIICDLPPSIETLNVNFLYASSRIVIPLEIEAKSLLIMKRNHEFLLRLKDLHPGFDWKKILVVANKYKQENIKTKVLLKLQDLYGENEDIQLSQTVFPLTSVVDKGSDLREPMFSLATKQGKEHKSGMIQAKELTDLFWVVCHELMDVELNKLIFSNLNGDSE